MAAWSASNTGFGHAQQQRRRDREAQDPGGLRVDHQLELRRPLEGQIAQFRDLEYQEAADTAKGAYGAPRQCRTYYVLGLCRRAG
jgi:hypothetical protein